jgi:HK97 family phage prohead protease
MDGQLWTGLEHKLQQVTRANEAGFTVSDGQVISGYASLFGRKDQGGDVVQKGAYAASLKRLGDEGRRVKMLWQHDPGQPIGIWDDVHEDAKGLWVKGRLLPEVEKGREAAALLAAGAIDGLSIGYRTVKAERDGKGQRLLQELELWEVSLVTFPMLPEARVGSKSDGLDATYKDLADLFNQAREELARR